MQFEKVSEIDLAYISNRERIDVWFGDFPTFGENSPSTIRISDFFSSSHLGYRLALVDMCSGSFGAQTGQLFSRLSVE
jgi:hypothetical protein